MNTRQDLQRAIGVSEHGMALLEVLVAVLLFSIGLLGMIGLQARAIQFSVESEMRSRAALFANDLASTMWLTNTVALDTAAGGSGSWNNRAKALLPNAQVKVEVVPAEIMANTADITIRWFPPQRAKGQAELSQLTTRVTLPPPQT